MPVASDSANVAEPSAGHEAGYVVLGDNARAGGIVDLGI